MDVFLPAKRQPTAQISTSLKHHATKYIIRQSVCFFANCACMKDCSYRRQQKNDTAGVHSCKFSDRMFLKVCD